MSTIEIARASGANPKMLPVLSAAIALAVALWVVIQFGVQTPRARLNIAQVVSVLFFAAALRAALRYRAYEPDAAVVMNWGAVLPALALSAATWACVIPCYFISDDYALLHQAQRLTSSTVWDFLTRSQATTFFRPLGQLSLLLDYHLWGFRPAGYHTVNLCLHLASVAGVFALAGELRLRPAARAACALVFGVLPIQIEAVAWMICRFDLLASACGIWAVVFYAGYRNTGRQTRYWAALSLFVLAMLSKESGYVVPLLLIPAEAFIFPRPKLKPWLGFAAAGALMFGFRWIHLGGIGGYVSASGIREVFILQFKTLEGLLLRGPTQAVLGINWLQPHGAWFTALCAVLAGALLVAAFVARPAMSERAAIRFGLCWIVASLLPVHSLILIGPGLTNARVMYMCSMGAAVVLGTMLAAVNGRRLSVILTGVVAISLGVVTLHNSQAWRWTAELSRVFPERLKQLEPAPRHNVEFVFAGMPETVRGVFFYRIGLADVIQMAYGREDLGARREGSGERDEQSRSIVRVEWVGDAAKQNPELVIRDPH